MTPLELNHLRYFYEVARHGGYTRAVKALHVQQSAISKTVAKLEDRIGSRLLERSAAGVRLTATGARLYAHCTRIFAEVDDFTRGLQGDTAIAGELRIGAATHVASYLLPAVLSALRERHPGIIPRIVTGPSHLLERELEDRRLDFALFFKVAPSRLLERTPLREYPCQLVVKRGLARQRDILESFIGSREVDDVTNRKFPTVAFLRRKGYATEIRYSCNCLESHVRWVRAGLGVSILPLFVVADALRARELEVVFPAYVYNARLELLTRRGDAPSPTGQVFRDVLLSTLDAHA